MPGCGGAAEGGVCREQVQAAGDWHCRAARMRGVAAGTGTAGRIVRR